VQALAVIVILIMSSLPASAQDGVRSLEQQMSELKSMIEQLRTETTALRQELQATREQLSAVVGTKTESLQPVENLAEEQELLSARVEEQYQTKVESASRYRVRLSGIVLMNLFSNRGVVDNIDFPTLALDEGPIYSRGSFGGSLRQSLLGFEVFGPEVAGARVNADVQFDFAGGFAKAPDGVTLGLPRLRTGGIRMTWPNTTLVAGQESPFFSPLSPGSIASLGVPALSYSGNLWTWIPQLRVERRQDLTTTTSLLLQGGILDPLTGEFPPSQFLRTPQAGEASRQPAYATRLAWTRRGSASPMTVGIGGYYSRHDWGFNRTVDAWAATSDWTIPAGSRWEFSGEFYRGRSLGGLGGGIGRSASFSGPLTDPLTRVRGLNSFGGWAQVKFRQTERLEWNAAFGQDNLLTRDLRAFPEEHSYYNSSMARNRSPLVNFIYRPRSDLLLSLEYRRLRTFTMRGYSETADHFNLSMGVLF
jgi:regulator of replication initiation timing